MNRFLGCGATSGRADDKDESAIRTRIREYEQKTAPLKDYYSAQKKFKGIDGVGSGEEITERVVAAI